MKQNMKKIAIALVATNVLASTIITTLPPVQTHAAEAKLTSNLKSSSGAMMDYVLSNVQQVTGRVPNGAGKHVTIEVFNSYTAQLMNTYVGEADSNGDYVIDTDPINFMQTVRVTFDNGVSQTQQVTTGNMTGFQVNPIKETDRTISGVFPGHPNTKLKVRDARYRDIILADTVTDSQGNFTFTLPADKSLTGMGGVDILAADEYYTIAVPFNPTPLPALPAVAVSTTGIASEVAAGKTGKLSTVVLPSSTPNQSVTYASSNPSVLKVDANGNWTTVAMGTATITVTSVSNPSIKTEIPVTVTSSAYDDATVAVNNLFINNNPANHIKDATNQAAIDAAQAKVNQVTNATQKAELQAQVNKAQA